MFIETRTEGPVGIATLNRPKILNAWHRPMRDALCDVLRGYIADDGVGAIVITGAGDRAFCAGQDLNEARDFDADRAEEWIKEWRVLYGLIRESPKPIIAALNGVTAGSAFQFALLCDLRVGHAGTTMGQPEIRSGLASITGPAIMLGHLGLSRTIDLTLTGRMLEGKECFRLGLINRFVSRETVLEVAIAEATTLAATSPLALRLTKEWLREMTDAHYERAMDAATRIHRQTYGSGASAEGIDKFYKARRGGANDSG